MNPKTVGLIVAEEMAGADLMGPAEVLSRATIGRSDQPEERESRRDPGDDDWYQRRTMRDRMRYYRQTGY